MKRFSVKIVIESAEKTVVEFHYEFLIPEFFIGFHKKKKNNCNFLLIFLKIRYEFFIYFFCNLLNMNFVKKFTSSKNQELRLFSNTIRTETLKNNTPNILAWVLLEHVFTILGYDLNISHGFQIKSNSRIPHIFQNFDRNS